MAVLTVALSVESLVGEKAVRLVDDWVDLWVDRMVDGKVAMLGQKSAGKKAELKVVRLVATLAALRVAKSVV